jgi:hypothetical protein
VTKALPFTQASLARAIKGVEKVGRHVVGVRPSDGMLIIADKPVDLASFVPAEAQSSPTLTRRFGENLHGGQGDAARS